MGRIIQLPLLFAALAFLLTACSNGTPKVKVRSDQAISFAGDRGLALVEFKVALSKYLTEVPEEERPVYIEFAADDDTPILFILQVKDALRKYYQIVRLQVAGTDGKLREEELLPAIEARENRSYEYVAARNLFSLYLGADGELFTDATLSQSIALEGLVDQLKTFIKSDPNNPDLPEMKEAYLPGVGSTMTSKEHMIRIVPTSTTTFGWYNEVSGAVARAYDEIYDTFCQDNFGRPYAEAEPAEQAILKMIYPRKVVEDPNVAGYEGATK